MVHKIVAISDVHNRWQSLKIPTCDILISTGDYSFHGEFMIVHKFHEWLNTQPAKHIISVQGNHETWVQDNFEEAKQIATKACPRVHFMEEGLVEIDGIKIWCSAWTPYFHNWAYNAVRGEEIKKHWDMIPDDTDILAVHGPPYGILDIVWDVSLTYPKERVGCHDLLEAVKRIKPDLFFCGHIHGSAGEHHEDGTSFYNTSVCDEIYCPTNPVTVVEYEKL